MLPLPVYACVDGPLRSTRKTPSVASIMMAPPPSPRAKLAMPVSALMASDAQLPAGLSPPGPQFRKDCWLSQKPSFDRRLWAYKKFFRNWGPESGKEAGGWGRDEIRNITGTFGIDYAGIKGVGGAFSYTGSQSSTTNNNGSNRNDSVRFSAASVVPTGQENVPPHVWQPLVIYLGRSAQV